MESDILVKTEPHSTKTCRICLSNSECQNIFDLNYDDQSIVDILKSCVKVELTKEKHSPDYICLSCVTELIEAYEVITKWQKSYEFLKPVEEIYILLDNINTEDKIDETVQSNHKCQLCPKQFVTYSGLKKHEKRHENIPSKKPTESLKDIETKKIIDDEVKQLKNGRKCPKCSKELMSLAGLKVHYRRVHANGAKPKIFTCKVCGKSLNTRKNFVRHLLVHTDSKPWKCEVCDKAFRQKNGLQVHMMIHTGKLGTYICENCAKPFRRKQELTNHHNNNLCTNIDDAKSTPTNCNLCSAPSISYNALRQHYSVAHCVKEYLCNKCGKAFVTSTGLRQHLRSHSGERTHICKVCNKKFVKKQSLKFHMYIHTGERPYCCEICGKAFTQQHHMMIHKRRHSGQKPYTCHICGKSFTIKGNLTVHIRTHTGETPYVCQVCGAGYHDSSSLKKHVVKQHLTSGVTDGKENEKLSDR